MTELLFIFLQGVDMVATLAMTLVVFLLSRAIMVAHLTGVRLIFTSSYEPPLANVVGITFCHPSLFPIASLSPLHSPVCLRSVVALGFVLISKCLYAASNS